MFDYVHRLTIWDIRYRYVYAIIMVALYLNGMEVWQDILPFVATTGFWICVIDIYRFDQCRKIHEKP